MSKQNHGRPSGHTLPCASLNEALRELRRPPSRGGVRFKIQNTGERAAQVAAYVDARLVLDRLDQVCGRRWFAEFEQLPERLLPPPVDDQGQVIPRPPIYVRCLLTVCGITRQDVGEGRDPKAAFSDALKRAAVQFGVGRALYAMRLPWLVEGDADSELRRNRKGRLILDRRSEAWCRDQYERWLEQRGIRAFGEPLDHDEDPAATSSTPEGEPQAPTGARAALRAVPDQPQAPSARHVGPGSLGEWQRRAGYDGETVARLAELMCGHAADRLSDAQRREVVWALQVAMSAQLSDPALSAQLAQALADEDRDAAREAFRKRLIDAADGRQLLGLRSA